MSHWLRRRLALPVVLLFTAVACSGGAAGEPKDQLVEALRATGQGAGVTVRMSLDTDEASLAALNAASEDPMPPEAMALFRNAWLRVSLPFDPEAKTAEVAVGSARDEMLSVRVVDEDLYVRVQAEQAVRAVGKDPAVLGGVRTMLAQTGVLPPEVLDGRWVVLRGAVDMAEQMSGQSGANPLDQARAREVMERLGRTLAEEAAVTRVGRDADGDHLRVVFPVRRLYEAFLEQVEAMGLPTAPGEAPAVEEVPDAPVTVDVWVRDGRVSVVSVDLKQLAALDPDTPEIPAEVSRLAVRIEFTPFDGIVEVPADPVELDPEALMGMFMGAMAPAFGGPMAGMGEMPPGFDPGMMPPGSSPVPPDDEQAMAAEREMAGFYDDPAYAEARASYCRQVADMPEEQRRHHADICP